MKAGWLSGCAECGFSGRLEPADLQTALEDAPSLFSAALPVAAGADRLRRRPTPAVWSPLEYVAHTRDAVAWYEERIRSVLDHPGVTLEGFDWDEACEARRYRDEDPGEARAGLDAACVSLAGVLAGLDDADWAASGVGSADGSPRSVHLLAQRAAHELRHHLVDVRRGMGR